MLDLSLFSDGGGDSLRNKDLLKSALRRLSRKSFDDSVILANHEACLQAECPTIWVFGYGSLMWKTGFQYDASEIGYIEHYERQFNQGNQTFRGDKTKPGRVANLEKKKGGKAWGVAFKVCGREEVMNVLRNLYIREIVNGGYEVVTASFHPRDRRRSSSRKHSHSTPTSVLSYCGETSIESSSSKRSSVSEDSSENLENTYSPCTFEDTEIVDMSVSDSESSDNLSSDSEDDKIDDVKVSTNHKPSEYHRNHYQNHHNNRAHTVETSVPSSRVRQPFQQLTPNTHHPDEVDSPVEVVVFNPTTENDLYLGSETVGTMARQIVEAKGSAGSNVEYVLQISEFVKKHIPEDQDALLFDLDAQIRDELRQKMHNSEWNSQTLTDNSTMLCVTG